MNFFEMFGYLDNVSPLSETEDEGFGTPNYQPKNLEQPQQYVEDSWGDQFSGYKTRPILYNVEGYISPYASNNWGGGCNILSSIDDISRLPSLENKVDPNKIFTSDIAALKTLAADQLKITKMFEKKLMEGLTDRGKVGLNENDTMAMQALTSARSAITAINKEQIAIKKNIAELRIKQQQASNANTAGVTGAAQQGGRSASSMDSGRSMLDAIFESSVATTPISNVTVPEHEIPTGTLEDAGRVIDELVSNVDNPRLKYEQLNPETFVVVNPDGSDAEFATYADHGKGELLADYPNPESNITKIDIDANTATDDTLTSYNVKIRE